MKVIVRAKTGWLRRPVSFTVSAWIHGFTLAWVVLGHPVRGPERARSLYEQEIRPNEKRIIWYSLRDRLPEIAPAPARTALRPPRALRKFEQTIVAGAREEAPPPQLIWQPAPEIPTPKPLPLPNAVAVARPARPIRNFTPPPLVKPAPRAAPALPDAPRATAALEAHELPFGVPAQRPRPLAFTPPPEVRRLPAVPSSLPAAPEIDASLPSATLPKAPRPFLRPPNRPSTAENAPPVSVDVPAVPATSGPSGEVSLAIVGLNPAKTAEIPAPPGSRQAGFSAGPKPATQADSLEPAGAESVRPESAILEVPGLLVHDGAADKRPVLAAGLGPTSRENLAAAARISHAAAPSASAPLPTVRVASVPDPSMQGRVVYIIAIQMPNITSYSGSWTVWFAERQPVPGAPPPDIRAPLALHKVDPKYIATAAAERVEGNVRLSAVIRRDGHVGAVTLLRHLDERLDHSAEEALSKWEFEPALRNGAPVEVDAVFEIPFRLAPRPAR